LNRVDVLIFGAAVLVAAAELVSGRLVDRDTEPRAQAAATKRDDVVPTATAATTHDDDTRAACPALQPRLPEMRMMGDDPDVPDLEDSALAMAPFYEHLAQVARGTAKDHVRIAVYGDSNLTRDYLTGAMRRTLNTVFGDGGHGYVALVKPWGWYQHMDVRHGDDGAWEGINVTTQTTYDERYGHAFIAAHSNWSKSRTWVETADENAPTGRTVSSFDIAYVKGPWYGGFAAEVDGQTLAEVDTNAPDFSAGFTKVTVPDGPHKLVVAVKSGSVQLLGVSLEREKPSVVVDSLGVGSMNCICMLRGDPAIHDATLQRRAYDLVIVHLGTNLFDARKVGPCYEEMIARHKHALPGVPMLIMTPPDFIGMKNPPRTAGWILDTMVAMKDVAKRTETPFFDFFAAMGGDGSMARFYEAHMTGPGDWVHFNADGAAYMSDRVLHAIWKGFARYLDEHPRAGCEP
jgi:lysophospholipase L1-like esterase